VAEDAKPSLLDIARSRNQRPGPVCKLYTLFATHPLADEIRALVDAAGKQEVWYSTAAAVLKEANVELSADTISRHARGRCSCPS
jgi:hypothetical protein